MKCSAQTSINADLPSPIIESGNFADPADGTLYASVLESPLAVSIPIWPNPAPAGCKDVVTLEWAEVTGSGVGAYVELAQMTFNGPVENFPDTVLYIHVAEALEEDGRYQLRYRIDTYIDTELESAYISIVCDSAPPYKYKVPSSFHLPTKQITIPFFEANDDVFVCVIPDYPDCQRGDVIAYFWRTATRTVEIGRIPVPDDRKVIYTRAQIEAAGNGEFYAEYRLYDKAGNQSQISSSEPINVSMAPRKLTAVKVSSAVGSSSFGSLKIDLVVDGVTINVPADADVYDGEIIRIQWASPQAFNSMTIDEPDPSSPLVYKVPMRNVAAHMVSSLADGASFIPVYYEVLDGRSLEVLATSSVYGLALTDILATNYPTVQCSHVSGNILSLSSVPVSGTEVSIGVWPFMADDQYINFKLVGLGQDGKNLEVVFFEHKVTAEEVADKKVNATVAKADIEKFKVGVNLYFEGEVTFNNKGYWYKFRPLRANLTN